MKIMFVSDIHGFSDKLDLVKDIYDEEDPDLIKEDSSLEEKENTRGDKKKSEKRKNKKDTSDLDVEESGLGFMNYYYFEAFNKIIFCTHGHRYNKYYLPEVDFDIFINGHTHVGLIEKEGNKYYLNPGSISLPRNGSRNSYMILDDSGIYLKDLVTSKAAPLITSFSKASIISSSLTALPLPTLINTASLFILLKKFLSKILSVSEFEGKVA